MLGPMAVPSGDRSVADADTGPRPRALSPRMAALVQKIDAARAEQLVRFRAKAEQDAKDDRAQRAARRARWAGRPISKKD